MSTRDVIQLRLDVKALLRRRVLEALEFVLEEAVADALGVRRHERGFYTHGHRNGAVEGRVTTANGKQTITVPHARSKTSGGSTIDLKGKLLPR